eukprot:8117223-Pyramimonas_sp.AAC.1
MGLCLEKDRPTDSHRLTSDRSMGGTWGSRLAARGYCMGSYEVKALEMLSGTSTVGHPARVLRRRAP